MKSRLSCCFVVAVGWGLCGCPLRADDAGLATKAQAILKTHCHGCHGKDGAAKGGFGYVLDRDLLLARNKVIAGKPADSELLQRARRGEMPPLSQKSRPNATELAVLEQWVAAGAPAVPGTAVPQKGVTETELPRLILADLQAIPSRQRRFYRYFTLTHLTQARAGEAELQTNRAALAKLVNSLSWHSRLTLPYAVDAGKTILRIDLRQLKWNPRSWERIVALYPYRFPGAEQDGERKALATATGSDLPFVRADWFVATASRPPLYYELLQLPIVDRQLERMLNVDALADIQEESVARAGFTDSGVSRNNRLIERHDAAYGAYWRSYDFSDNLDQQNLFTRPLGPTPTATTPFVHAGGEIIFNLPNGLQAYLLVDSAGRRVDQAPSEIVSDPRRSDRKVVAGLSCMSCHARGLIPKADQVRAHLEKNPRAFSPADADMIRSLYPHEARMRALMNEDIQRFEQALKNLGIAPEQEEPITLVVARYEGNLVLAGAAAEAGVSPEVLANRLHRSPSLARLLGPVRAKGGSASRDTFEAAFAELVRELHPIKPTPPAIVEAGKGASSVDGLPFSGHQGSIRCVTVAPDGRWAASGSDDKSVRLWDMARGRELRRFNGHTDQVIALSFSADGRQVASGGDDRSVRIWDASTGKQLHCFTGHSGPVRAVAFAPDGGLVASGSQDGTLRLWDVRAGKEVRAFTGHEGWITSVAFSPDGRRLLSGGHDRSVRLWDALTGKELRRLEGHTREVYAVAYSADGKRALSGGNDRTVRLWNVEDGKELVRFTGHVNAIIAVSFAPGGQQVFSASSQYQTADKVLRVWNAETGREVKTYGGAETDRVGCAAFAPDGRSAISGSGDSTLRLWILKPDKE